VLRQAASLGVGGGSMAGHGSSKLSQVTAGKLLVLSLSLY